MRINKLQVDLIRKATNVRVTIDGIPRKRYRIYTSWIAVARRLQKRMPSMKYVTLYAGRTACIDFRVSKTYGSVQDFEKDFAQLETAARAILTLEINKLNTAASKKRKAEAELRKKIQLRVSVRTQVEREFAKKIETEIKRRTKALHK